MRSEIGFRYGILLACTAAITAVQIDAAVAGDKVTGTFFLSQENCTKTGGNADCQLNFQISGDSARVLYERMSGKAVENECTGGKSKEDGHGLNCYFSDGKNYNCDFGYNFKRKAFGPSDVDC